MYHCNDHSDTWIECILVDEFNVPLANLPYVLKVDSGIVREGQTDTQGYLREENLMCTVATLTLSAQKLTDEMENRALRALRGETYSTVKPDAESKGYFYRYAVIGELCDKAPDIALWEYTKFGLPYYHFPKENEFRGIEFQGEYLNHCHMIEVCPFRAWSLILKHIPEYDIVNAYNLGLMSLLVYKNEIMVDSSNIEDMRGFINTPDTVTSFFYQHCFDLSKNPTINDNFAYPAIVKDVAFNERYRSVIFLDVSQSGNYNKIDHDTKTFCVENNKQLIIAWRGTASKRSLFTDVTYEPILCPTNIIPNSGSKVHRGFLEAYQCVEKYFYKKIECLENSLIIKELFITGHSLGGALALLNAAELKSKDPLLYTYGMPRVLTISGAKELVSLKHFRHVNDADTVTSIPFDTNMDSWLFDVGGWLGTTLGALWTFSTLPTIPLQKILPDFGEVYCHQGEPVSFFNARQIGEERIPSESGRENDFVGKKRWRMNGEYKFYLVPNIRESLNFDLKKEQNVLVRSLSNNKNMLDKDFPQFNNPNLDTLFTLPLEHSMGSGYQTIINNKLLSILEPNKTPKLIVSKEKFNELIHRKDAYELNAKRNITFMGLENKLKENLKKNIGQDFELKKALDRYTRYTHEILAS